MPVSSVTELLRVARQHYDYVIVDTPPAFTEHVLSACDVSNMLILIATLDIPAVKNLRIALDTLDILGNPRDSRVIVLNRADTKVGLRPEDVVTAIKQPIALSIPRQHQRAGLHQPRGAHRARRAATPREHRHPGAGGRPGPPALRRAHGIGRDTSRPPVRRE